MLRRNTFLVSVLSILMVTMILYLDNSLKQRNLIKTTAAKKHFVKTFLYIVNTDECIRDYLMEKDVLGDSENLDVLAVSYKTPCNKVERNHITYLFGPNTTWGSGRNLAWTYVQEHLGNYMYYVFMDEDVEFKPTLPRILSEATQNKLKTNTSILRQFEDFLVDTRPAVGAPFRSVDDPLGIYDFNECCPGEDDHDKQWNLPEIIPMIRFDECFTAFHHKAIGHIMPLDTRYDAISWWGAGRYLHMKSYYYFHRQLARYTPMTVHNPQHKDYPKEFTPYVDIINNIKSEVPEAYKNATIFTKDLEIMAGNGWQRHIHIHPLNPTFELAPKKDAIVPFKYIDTVRKL